MTVYDHIAENNRKTWFLVLLFPTSLSLLMIGFCIAAMYAIGDPIFAIEGIKTVAHYTGYYPTLSDQSVYFWGGLSYALLALPVVFGIALLWMGISYLLGDKMMLAFAGAKPITQKDNPKIYRMVENVSIAAGLPMPKVYIVDDESLNAFATGRDPKHASVALTKGIIAKLEPLELEAVIAHEMAHVGNRDIRLNMLIITGLSIFAFAADFLRIALRGTSSATVRSSNNKKGGQAQVLLLFIIAALLVFNFLVAPIIRFAVSRTREYAADATGALITRNPEALASALEKISQDSRVEILDKTPTMATACIANPKHSEKMEFTSPYSTHPPIKSRIDRLRKM